MVEFNKKDVGKPKNFIKTGNAPKAFEKLGGKGGELIKTKTKQNLSPEERTKLNSKLVKAVELGKIGKIKVLLEEGADVNVRDVTSWTPLHIAINQSGIAVNYIRNLELIKLLIAKGANINVTDYEGMTPLHFTAYAGDIKIAKLLIKEGADVNATGHHRWTPLHLAAIHDCPKYISFLLGKGARMDVRDSDGKTPWGKADEFNNTKCTKLLQRLFFYA